MKLIIDKDIPFIKGVFEPFGEVLYCSGSEINRSVIKDADGLIIRTRTKCTESLLEGSPIRFIASATIGTDHVDLPYCLSRGIHFSNAAGCNSLAVMQYVFTALFSLAGTGKFSLGYGSFAFREGVQTIGVIGVGNVGSKVAAFGEYLGFKVLRNDPPREAAQRDALKRGEIREEEAVGFCSIEKILDCSDIITLHVPLTQTTENMADESFFGKMKKGAVLINSSRGEVVEENALIRNREKLSALVLDVWRDEPAINDRLLSLTDIATPHIAGYSVEGKARGTLMVIKAAARYFGIEPLIEYKIPVEAYDPSLTPRLDLKGKSCREIYEELYTIFPIFDLDRLLKENIGEFERIRSNYNLRREFHVNPER